MNVIYSITLVVCIAVMVAHADPVPLKEFGRDLFLEFDENTDDYITNNFVNNVAPGINTSNVPIDANNDATHVPQNSQDQQLTPLQMALPPKSDTNDGDDDDITMLTSLFNRLKEEVQENRMRKSHLLKKQDTTEFLEIPDVLNFEKMSSNSNSSSSNMSIDNKNKMVGELTTPNLNDPNLNSSNNSSDNSSNSDDSDNDFLGALLSTLKAKAEESKKLKSRNRSTSHTQSHSAAKKGQDLSVVAAMIAQLGAGIGATEFINDDNEAVRNSLALNNKDPLLEGSRDMKMLEETSASDSLAQNAAKDNALIKTLEKMGIQSHMAESEAVQVYSEERTQGSDAMKDCIASSFNCLKKAGKDNNAERLKCTLKALGCMDHKL